MVKKQEAADDIRNHEPEINIEPKPGSVEDILELLVDSQWELERERRQGRQSPNPKGNPAQQQGSQDGCTTTGISQHAIK